MNIHILQKLMECFSYHRDGVLEKLIQKRHGLGAQEKAQNGQAEFGHMIGKYKIQVLIGEICHGRMIYFISNHAVSILQY